MEGKLYLCPTPIGNLEDITLRVIHTLEACQAVYCEDTRRTGQLLRHLGVAKPLVSCHAHNEAQRGQEIVERVLAGEAIAYASDAGMPGISDPGERLIQRCQAAGAPYEVLPGPSASLTALVASGLRVQEAVFVGFLPRSGKERREWIARLGRQTGSLILYESPLRLSDTAKELAQAWGDRPAVLCRELTKLHQQVLPASLEALGRLYEAQPPKGECVLVVGGRPPEGPATESLEDTLLRLLQGGLRAKDAARQASDLLDVPRNVAYARALELKEQLKNPSGSDTLE